MSHQIIIAHPLIRSAYYHIMSQFEEITSECLSRWYSINVGELGADIAAKVETHHCDTDTLEFIQSSKNISYGKHILDSLMSIFLYPFFGATSRNGILNRGVMFVASRDLFSKLVSFAERHNSLLDIGAGDGSVTKNMETHYSEIYVTECSAPMQYRLRTRGYHLMEINEWQKLNYDAVSCLNVLDRCDDPYKLLSDIFNNLKINGGLLILAVVLPYHGLVEKSNEWKPQPNPLKINGYSFEEQLASLIRDILMPMGYQLNMATKVPYLCSGDLNASYYSLNDALLSLTVAKQK